jgi:hypothetical protein
MLILIAARHAMVAAIDRRNSSIEARRNSLSAISRISNRAFSISPARSPAGADFTAMVRLPNGSLSNPSAFSSSAIRAYSICCAAVSEIDFALVALRQHLFEQNALMRHVLVDNPQPVASRSDDEAVVNLAKRPQVFE